MCSIESHHRYFYMDVVPHHDTKVPWVDITPTNKVNILLYNKCM